LIYITFIEIITVGAMAHGTMTGRRLFTAGRADPTIEDGE
jgi:hypothetical protein